MLYANVRGVDGTILGSRVVDPTAPGGLQKQLQNIVNQQAAKQPQAQLGYPPPRWEQQRWHEQQRWQQRPWQQQRPWRQPWQQQPQPPQPPWQPQPPPSAEPSAGMCYFRVNVGGAWQEVNAPCPPGIPPGRYHQEIAASGPPGALGQQARLRGALGHHAVIRR